MEHLRRVQDIIAGHFAESMDAAVARYKAGEDDVMWEFGEFTLSLRNLGDNADREVVRFTLEDLRAVAVALVTYGAQQAGALVTLRVARQFGLLKDAKEVTP